tara:strand:- start:1912 stop:2079 length:168 start_codon:yes stop_codon:yes gene_type:complete
MNKVYPVSIPKKKDDEMYGLMKCMVCILLLCVCMCVGLIIMITLLIENDTKDGSN